MGKGKDMSKCKLKKKQQKTRQTQKSEKKKGPKTRVKDDYVKR